MGKLGDGSYGLLGYSCVSKPHCTQDDPDAPLMYAIGYALDGHADLGHFLRAVFRPYPEGVPGGGDPGWSWYHEQDERGEDRVIVELDALLAPPDGIWQSYSESKIRYEVRVALDNLAHENPARLSDVDTVVRQYGLEEVHSPEGTARVPRWNGTRPASIIRNE